MDLFVRFHDFTENENLLHEEILNYYRKKKKKIRKTKIVTIIHSALNSIYIMRQEKKINILIRKVIKIIFNI